MPSCHTDHLAEKRLGNGTHGLVQVRAFPDELEQAKVIVDRDYAPLRYNSVILVQSLIGFRWFQQHSLRTASITLATMDWIIEHRPPGCRPDCVATRPDRSPPLRRERVGGEDGIVQDHRLGLGQEGAVLGGLTAAEAPGAPRREAGRAWRGPLTGWPRRWWAMARKARSEGSFSLFRAFDRVRVARASATRPARYWATPKVLRYGPLSGSTRQAALARRRPRL